MKFKRKLIEILKKIIVLVVIFSAFAGANVNVKGVEQNAETGETLTSSELIAQGYQLPEAFNFGDSNVATAISGYWMSKYQLSN